MQVLITSTEQCQKRLKGLRFESYSKATALLLTGKYNNATYQIIEKISTMVKKRMKCMCSLQQGMQCNRQSVTLSIWDYSGQEGDFQICVMHILLVLMETASPSGTVSPAALSLVLAWLTAFRAFFPCLSPKLLCFKFQVIMRFLFKLVHVHFFWKQINSCSL